MSQTAECRQCTKCLAMYFDQYSSKGTCPAGGSHQGGVYQFELPYGLPETPNGQFNWWVCDKCVSVFYNGYPDKGVCPGGGGHQELAEVRLPLGLQRRSDLVVARRLALLR